MTSETVSSPYEFILYNVGEGIAEIVFNRPQVLNAHHAPMYREICDAFTSAEADERVRVIVVRGTGRAFCVGRDFKYAAQLQEDENSPSGWRHLFKGFIRYTLLNEKMVVALVQGYALGGGGSVALGADITIATPDAKFGYPETRHGIASKIMIWPWVLGAKVAKEIVGTGRLITAEEGMHLGLVNRVVPLEELESVGRAVARDIAAMPPGVPEMVKRVVNRASRDMIRVMSDDRKFDVDTAAWDTAGVEPSPWMLSARAAREAFLEEVGQGASDK